MKLVAGVNRMVVENVEIEDPARQPLLRQTTKDIDMLMMTD